MRVNRNNLLWITLMNVPCPDSTRSSSVKTQCRKSFQLRLFILRARHGVCETGDSKVVLCTLRKMRHFEEVMRRVKGTHGFQPSYVLFH